MINIHKDFTGGNIIVDRIEGNTVYLKNELRDTEGYWFYWAFCVEGAQGRELKFSLESGWIGYWGPAVSHDLKTWHWLGESHGNTFTYEFTQDENRVYFAHNMLYHPDRFELLCHDLKLHTTELCISRKGRSVPCLGLGNGERSIILTSRHHACESTGSYVLEGVIIELTRAPIENSRILCVPFVDYDGVVDGDQGKSRKPHDHNRDYIEKPIYPEVTSIYSYVKKYGCNYAFDFHSPWHSGDVNDTIFVVRNRKDKEDRYERFSSILESEIMSGSMTYKKENDYPAGKDWNTPSPNFAYTMNCREECDIAFSLESAYFGTSDNVVTAERLVEFGKCFAHALKKYITD